MPVPRLLLIMLLASLPPLTSEQAIRLDSAFDGRDHQEEAFVALLENARAYAAGPSGVGDTFVRVDPDFALMAETPDEYRGDVCRVAGVLQQHSKLARPYGEVREWFVRPAGDAAPILVYVVGEGSGDDETFREGVAVEIFARFYKRVDATARDGRVHRYPAFVGAHPRLTRAGGGGGGGVATGVSGVLALAAVFLLGLVVVFALLVFAARRPRRRLGPRPRGGDDDDGGDPDDLDETAGLPDDPADALATLRERAGTGE